MDTIYTETPGTTCYLDGARGAVTGLNTTAAILIPIRYWRNTK